MIEPPNQPQKQPPKQPTTQPATQRLLLIGAGHAHALVLKHWIAAPVPGVELVIVSPSALAPYSGMVPGWLAGTYRFEQICIDFAALAQAAGATLLIDELAALHPDQHTVHLRSGAEIGYTVLSLNVGSTLSPPPAQGGTRVLAMRPLGGLHHAWNALLAEPTFSRGIQPRLITAVGGGAAGVESLLAALARLRALQPQRPVRGQLFNRGPVLLPGLARGAARSAQAALVAAGVDVKLGATLDSTLSGAGDLLLWATGACAHGWQQPSGLATSAAGFIRIDEHLRSVSHPDVFAAGDCAEWATPLPKAGVFAVRMGPVLARNLCAALGVGTPEPYAPQRRVLALLATADGRAVAAWGPLSAQGRWVWRWKDHIDRRFLAQFEGMGLRDAASGR